MDKTNEHVLKDDALNWAQMEYKADPVYWQDRLKNGSGLIQQIASFVLEQAQAEARQQ